MKISIILVGFLLAYSALATEEFELPAHQLRSVKFNDVMESTKPGVMMRQVAYLSAASSEDLVAFYRELPVVKTCRRNPMALNFHCKLTSHGTISSGDLFIGLTEEDGLIEVFADYFYRDE